MLCLHSRSWLSSGLDLRLWPPTHQQPCRSSPSSSWAQAQSNLTEIRGPSAQAELVRVPQRRPGPVAGGSRCGQLANSTVLDRCTDRKPVPDTDEMHLISFS